MTKKRKGGGKNHSNKKKKKNKKKLSKEIKSHGKKFKEEQEWSAVSASSTVKEADFSLDQVTSHLCKQIPCVLNIHDEQLSLSLFEGMRRNDMDDIVSWFLRKEGFDSNEKQLSGPPKWNYTLGDYSDSFDYYAITGCKEKK